MGEDVETRICRNCHEGGGELICPCHCSGSIKWVHRSCLDTWRSVSPNPSSFSVCDLCRTPYRLRRHHVSGCTRFLFGAKVFRDVFAVLLGIAALIAVFGVAAWGIDSATGLSRMWPKDWQDTVQAIPFRIFVYGPALLCFVLGIIGIVFGVARACGGCTCDACCMAPTYTYGTYGYHSCFPPWWWWWCWWTPPGRCDCDCGSCSGGHGGDCNCSGGGGGGGDCGKAALIIVAVIVVIIILIGFFVGVALLVMIIYRLVRNHHHVLKMEVEALGMQVVDISTCPEPTADEVVIDIPQATAPQFPPLTDDPTKPLFIS